MLQPPPLVQRGRCERLDVVAGDEEEVRPVGEDGSPDRLGLLLIGTGADFDPGQGRGCLRPGRP